MCHHANNTAAFVTLRGVHASHGKHGSHGGLPRPRAGTLKQGAPLREQVILHALHQQPLALHAVPEQRVGLQIGQELHARKTKSAVGSDKIKIERMHIKQANTGSWSYLISTIITDNFVE